MLRLIATITITLVANAVALIVAALVLDDMALDAVGFTVALLVFTGTAILIEPLIRQLAITRMPAVLGSTALIGTLVSLVVAVVVTDGLRISGIVTWILAAILVWVLALGARLLLPLIIFKRVLAERGSGRGPAR